MAVFVLHTVSHLPVKLIIFILCARKTRRQD